MGRARQAIAAVRPDLADAPLRFHTDGWDCLAVEADDTWIFKLPYNEAAVDRLLREPRTIELIRPRTALELPAMRLHRDPLLMTEHRKVPGGMVDAARYAKMDEDARARLAHDVAGFFAAVHGVDPAHVRRLDCDAVRPWAAAAALLAPLAGAVPGEILAMAGATLARHTDHPRDEEVFGQFDTHGWNMAFDPASERLVGLFDFAGAGVGPLHRDLSYPTFVAPDLTRRVVESYGKMTGRPVDLGRVYDAHGALRVIELSDALAAGDDPTQFLEALRDHTSWRNALDRRQP